MKIVFIRHLKTPGNEKRQYIGRTDEDLSEPGGGRVQAASGKKNWRAVSACTAYHRKPAEAVHPDCRTYLSGAGNLYRTDAQGV